MSGTGAPATEVEPPTSANPEGSAKLYWVWATAYFTRSSPSWARWISSNSISLVSGTSVPTT